MIRIKIKTNKLNIHNAIIEHRGLKYIITPKSPNKVRIYDYPKKHHYQDWNRGEVIQYIKDTGEDQWKIIGYDKS